MARNFIESTVYSMPEAPPKVRDRPMMVICPGFSRSATESLQTALIKLGYDHTYHGWNVTFDQPSNMQGWVRLCRKKFNGEEADGTRINGDCSISREEFDAILGNSQAICDAPAAIFAADLIRAYPEAKVVLNTPLDMERWHASIIRNILSICESWNVYINSRFNAYGYWTYELWCNNILPNLFRAGTVHFNRAHRSNGIWIYKEHIAMIKGLVPQERLLEWHVQDGWEPLCKFLGNEIPNEPFPRTNDAAGFTKTVSKFHEKNDRTAKMLTRGTLAVMLVAGMWKLGPGKTTPLSSLLQTVMGTAKSIFA